MNVIVLPGCGPNIVYILGYMIKNRLINNHIFIDVFVGVSSGAILCLLLSLNLSLKEIFYIFYNNNTLKINSSSLFDLKNFIDNIFKVFDKKNIKKSITFLEYFTQYNKNLNFVCFNTQTKKGEIFNHIFTPNVKILDSVAASCSLPVVFDNVIIENNKYIDGIFYDYLPLNIIPNFLFLNKNNVNFHIYHFGYIKKKSHLEFINNNKEFNFIIHKLDTNIINSIFISKIDIENMLVLGFFNTNDEKYILNSDIYFYAIKNLM